MWEIAGFIGSSMKRNVVMSVNYNAIYFQFIPLVMTVWKEWGFNPILTLITDRPEKDWKWMKEYAEIRHYNIRKDLDEGVWTKVARFFSYFETDDQKYCISDIDLIPLNKEYFDKIFEYPEELIVSDSPFLHPSWLAKHYPPDPQFPGAYLVAKGKTWREIVNPNNLDNEGMLNSYKHTYKYEIKEDITQPYDNFSEDTLMRRLIYNWNPDKSKIRFLKRGYNAIGDPYSLKRIDRGRWYWDQKMLDEHYYIDSHCLRPIQGNVDRIAPLVKSIGFPVELLNLGIQKYKESL